jgi:hypothetical protein
MLGPLCTAPPKKLPHPREKDFFQAAVPQRDKNLDRADCLYPILTNREEIFKTGEIVSSLRYLRFLYTKLATFIKLPGKKRV